MLKGDKGSVVCDNFRLNNYCSELTSVQKEKLASVLKSDNDSYSFISFNYTDTLETFLGQQENISIFRQKPGPIRYPRYKEIIHAHGTYEKDMVFGLNDDSQVECHDTLKHEKPLFYEELIKREANRVFEERTEEKTVEILNSADILIFFGLSIGPSDKRWWLRIGDWLRKKNGAGIIFLQELDLVKPSISRALYRESIKERREDFLKNVV